MNYKMSKEEFKKWRKERGSQADIADLLGYTIRAIYHYEAGTRPVPKPAIAHITTLRKFK